MQSAVLKQQTAFTERRKRRNEKDVYIILEIW